MRIAIAPIKGTRTRYYHGGRGKPVLMVHGVGMSADTWFPAMQKLEPQFSLCAPDLLDSGFTDAGGYTGGAPQPHMLEHLLALADHLGWRRFSVVGSSLGALLAGLLFLRAPSRVDKLVLVGPAAMLEPPEATARSFAAAHRNGRSALEDPSYQGCRARMGRAVYDAASVPDSLILMQMLLYAMPGAAEKFERRMSGLATEKSLKEFTIYNRLEEITVPVLAMIGRNDPRGHYAQTVAGAQRLPKCKLVTYEHCGHWPHIEYPDQFSSDVAAFLG